MEITLVPNLDFSHEGLISSHDRRLTIENSLVSLKQGDLDGACGPYALMISLIAYGAISRNDAIEVWQGKLDLRTKFAKMISNHPALLREGTEASELVEMFNAIKSQKIKGLATNSKFQKLEIKPVVDRGQLLFKQVKKTIDAGLPAIICLEWGKTSAHWVVAVGYQGFRKSHEDKSVESKMESILVLDPGGEMPNVGAWNGVLQTRGHQSSLPFQYWSTGQGMTDCDADGGLLFEES